MMQRLREMLASGLVAIAFLVIMWWILRGLLGWFLWVVNLVVLVSVVLLLLAGARRLRQPKKPRL